MASEKGIHHIRKVICILRPLAGSVIAFILCIVSPTTLALKLLQEAFRGLCGDFGCMIQQGTVSQRNQEQKEDAFLPVFKNVAGSRFLLLGYRNDFRHIPFTESIGSCGS